MARKRRRPPTKKQALLRWAKARGVDLSDDAPPQIVVETVECELGLDLSYVNSKKRIEHLYNRLFESKAPLPAQISKISKERVAAFYQSFEWRKARYEAIKKHGAKCMACGRSAKDGAVLNVDHIKPVRRYWDLRLEPTNHQVLCEICNHGKGNWDETNWGEENKK